MGLATLGSVSLQAIFSRIPFALYFAAVMLAARYGGLGPGLLTSILGVLAADYFLLPPLGTLGPVSLDEALMLGILALVSLLISSMTASMRSAQATERRQREWLQTTLASIGDAVVATDAEGRVTLMNAVAASLTGWSPEEAHGRPLAQVLRIVDEHTRAATASPVETALREDRITGLANHTVLIARDGVEHPIDDSAAPIRDMQGRVSGAVLVFRDVTERRQAEEALRQSEQRLHLATSAAGIGRFEVDWIERRRFWSAELRALLAVPDDLDIDADVGLLDRILPAEHRGRYRAALAASLDPRGNGECEDEHEVVRLDGTRAWMLIRGKTFFEAGPNGMRAARTLGLMMDITDRRAAEREREALLEREHAALAEAEAARHRVSTTLESIADAFLTLDRDWRYSYLNDRAVAMTRMRA